MEQKHLFRSFSLTNPQGFQTSGLIRFGNGANLGQVKNHHYINTFPGNYKILFLYLSETHQIYTKVPVAPLHNEKELLASAASGDNIAFATLFDHYQAKVFSVSWKLTGVRTAAEDVVQEVFLKLWVNKAKLPEIENFNAYLNTVTSNHIFNMLRKVSNEHTFLKEMLAKEPGNSSDTLTIVSYNELMNLFHRAISQLPPQQRKVYQLSREEGLKYEEIAEQLNIARSTVKTHMVEAIRSVKMYLQNNGVAIDLHVLILIGALSVCAQA